MRIFNLGYREGYDAAQKLHANAPAPVGQERPLRYRSVRVLTLCWKNNDLNDHCPETIGINDELRRVTEAFRSYNYDTRHYDIPEKWSTRRLEPKLCSLGARVSNDTLVIIYYNGHGSFSEPAKGLALVG